MEKKLRIQLFTPEGSMVDDRLVSQKGEFNIGPKFQHDGPIRIEFTLTEKPDVEAAKTYLDQLTGILPLIGKEKKVKVNSLDDLTDKDQREDLLNHLKENAKTIELFIKGLREANFQFMLYDRIEALELPVTIKDIHKEKYQFMVRCMKQAKDPANDRFDPMLMVGFQLLPEMGPKIVIYKDGEFLESLKLTMPLNPSKSLPFVKGEYTKFPDFMEADEREKWRKEHRLCTTDPSREPSKFYQRWAKHITIK